MRRLIRSLVCALLLTSFGTGSTAGAAEALNIYSARHYDSDDLLYDGFERILVRLDPLFRVEREFHDIAGAEGRDQVDRLYAGWKSAVKRVL